YAWLRNASLVGTNATLTVTNISAADAGPYFIIVRNQCGDALTNSASLVLSTPTAASPLTSVTNNLGTSVTFSTTASGTGPFTYLWKKNGTNIVGATTNSLTLTNLTFTNGA